MEKTNFFEKFKNNIYNIKTFPKYIREGVGRAILYALILSLFLGGIKGVYDAFKIRGYMDSTINQIKNSKEDFSIKDGILKMNDSPLKIEDGSNIIYLDSNKKLENADELKKIYIHGDFYMLVLQDGIKIGGNNINEEVKYKDVLLQDINKETIINELLLSSKIIVPIVAIFNFITYIFDLLMNSLIVSAIGILIGIFMGLRIKFSAIYSLSIYAATLPSLIVLPISIIYPNAYFTMPVILGTVIYMFFILKNIKKELIENMKL